MKIERPKRIELKISDFKAEISFPQLIYAKDQLVDIYIAPTIVKLEQKENKGKPILTIDPKMFDQELYNRFNRLTYSIGKLNRLAELVYEKLKRTVSLYLAINKFEELSCRNKKCKNIENYDLTKDLTFGQLRNILSCIIKTDKEFEQFTGLDTAEKRNIFTKFFDDYIVDRDCYTHGILYFLYPNFEPILKVKPPNSEEHYVSISEKILRDNLLVYNYLDKILSNINQIWQEKTAR